MSILCKDVNKILIKIQKGDENSKNVLFEKTYSHLQIVARRYVWNKNDIEDLLMETYLKVFRYIYAFKPTADGYNWICKILQNTAYDFNKEHRQEILMDEWNGNAYEMDIEELIATSDELRRWLASYSAREQKIMYLRYWEGRNIQEIAQALGMGKSNVHKQIKKIEKKIKEKTPYAVEK